MSANPKFHSISLCDPLFWRYSPTWVKWHEKYYLLIKKVNNKMREFQFKILKIDIWQQTLWCSRWQWNTNTCTFCDIEIETSEDLFWEWIYVRNVWIQLETNLCDCESGGYHFEIKWVKYNVCLIWQIRSNACFELRNFLWEIFYYLCKLRSAIPELTINI